MVPIIKKLFVVEKGEEITVKKSYLIILVLFIISVVIKEILSSQFNFLKWDVMLLSCYIFVIFITLLAARIPAKFDALMLRLFQSPVVEEKGKYNEISIFIRKKKQLWGLLGSFIISLLITTALLTEYWREFAGLNFLKFQLLEIILGAISGFIVGKYVGLYFLYAFIFYLLKSKLHIKAQPAHMDGAGGLKPIGEFYFQMSVISFIPILFIGAWYILIKNKVPFVIVDKGKEILRYLKWDYSYLVFFILAILFEISIFIFPLFDIHRKMVSAKRAYDPEKDELASEISNLKIKLSNLLSEPERKELSEQLAYKTKRYLDIENMRTWPFDKKTLGKFTISNIALTCLPNFIDFIKNIKSLKTL
ncbi:MAG TPA: hypothetical protein VHY08_28375 [Bacillota bacterium]|nr:hypothetical protein [Bacillota bacterium]